MYPMNWLLTLKTMAQIHTAIMLVFVLALAKMLEIHGLFPMAPQKEQFLGMVLLGEDS